MGKIENKLTGEFGKFFYNILNDVLFLSLLAYAMLLISEGIIPGLVSAYLSFTRLTLVVFAVIGAIVYLGKINEISFEFNSKKTALLCGLIIFSLILIVNSLLKFAGWEIGIIAIASIFLLVYLYKNLFNNQ